MFTERSFSAEIAAAQAGKMAEQYVSVVTALVGLSLNAFEYKISRHTSVQALS
jgi:hypothetical protein